MKPVQTYRAVFLIGAARSGTKLVRDIIAEHHSVDKVPYDINYIWRLGNGGLAHDELHPDLLTAKIQSRILKQIAKFSKGAPILIEKTVSNCLRIPYLKAIYPDALFIHLIRDGLDVVESVYRQWIAAPDWNYIFRKAMSFPFLDAFGYAVRYGTLTVHKMLAKNSTPDIWGPRYDGILQDVKNMEIIEVCAVQWVRSVEKALRHIKKLPVEKCLTVRYEDFVEDPHSLLDLIGGFLGIDPAYYHNLDLISISKINIGKGRKNLRPEQANLVLPLIKDTRKYLGYSE